MGVDITVEMRVITRHFATVEDVEAAYKTPDESESVEDRRKRKARRRAALARFRERQHQERLDSNAGGSFEVGQALGEADGTGRELPPARAGRTIEDLEAGYNTPDTYEPPNERRKRGARRRSALRRLRARLQRDEGEESKEAEDAAVGHDLERLQSGDDVEEEESDGAEVWPVTTQAIDEMPSGGRGNVVEGEEGGNNDGIEMTRQVLQETNTANQAARRLRMKEHECARLMQEHTHKVATGSRNCGPSNYIAVLPSLSKSSTPTLDLTYLVHGCACASTARRSYGQPKVARCVVFEEMYSLHRYLRHHLR